METNIVSLTSGTVRKKTPGACERCRERRVKCDGCQPCDQCIKKNFQCTYTFAPTSGNEALAEKLDLVLSRLNQLEQKLSQNKTHNARFSTVERGEKGLAQLNMQSGCFEYYGGTSAFVVASSLGKRSRHRDETSDTNQPSKSRRIDDDPRLLSSATSKELKGLDLDELTGFCDYVIPPGELRHHRSLRDDVADRHLENFFRTIHIFLPVFDESKFRENYNTVRPLFGDNRLFMPTPENRNRPQFICLVHAVLALGALYEDEQEDSSSWASWYFVQAQEMLGRFLDAVNIDLVQAAMLMGAYAQHAIKPNLAYILNGLATRLAISIGLHIESDHSISRFGTEEARRTWWLIFIQEVELSLDSGRPMSIRMSEMNLKYPAAHLKLERQPELQQSQAAFIPVLAEIAKIIHRVLQLVGDSGNPLDPVIAMETEALLEELKAWRAALPSYLRFYDPKHDFKENHGFSPSCWQARQQSSLRIHYNIAVIILLRKSLAKSKHSSCEHDKGLQVVAPHAAVCVDAARDMVRHVHELFTLAPSLRRWTYYCFYCLQATLVLLAAITDDNLSPHPQPSQNSIIASTDLQPPEQPVTITQEGDLYLCELSVEIFQRIELKASRRCAEHVHRFLEKWKAKTVGRAIESAPPSRLARRQPSKPELARVYHTGRSASRMQDETEDLESSVVQSSTLPQPESTHTTTTGYPPAFFPMQMPNNGSTLVMPHYSSSSMSTALSAASGSVASTNGTNETSPMSLGGLQADLYDTLYYGDQEPDFNFPVDSRWCIPGTWNVYDDGTWT